MEWRVTVQSPKYEISDTGLFRNAKTKRVLFQDHSIEGHPRCKFGRKGRIWTRDVVAKTFVPNPEGYQFVENIDGDPTNCCASNLRWVRGDSY